MTGTIVVPLDRSALAEGALPTAVALARATGSSIRLLHAPFRMPPLSELAVMRADAAVPGSSGQSFLGSDPGSDPSSDPGFDPTTEPGAHYLCRIAESLRVEAGVTVETAVIDGPVADAISADARANDASAIVMSTHGRTGWSRLWIGSVADEVVRHASVPVLLVRPESNGATSLPPRAPRVLVPLDGSPFAERALGPTMALLDGLGASYLLVRVVNPVVTAEFGSAMGMPPVFLPDEDATSENEREAARYLEAVATRMRARRPGAQIETRVALHEQTARAIVEVARSVDLVAMVTHGRGASRLLLGSVTDKVLRGTRGALLVIGAER